MEEVSYLVGSSPTMVRDLSRQFDNKSRESGTPHCIKLRCPCFLLAGKHMESSYYVWYDVVDFFPSAILEMKNYPWFIRKY